MMNERHFDPLGMLVGGALGVFAYVAAILGAVPYSTSTAGAYRALAIIYGAVFAVGLVVGLLCRKRRLSRRGLWLTGGGAGLLAGGVITMLVVSGGANAGSINVAGAWLTFGLVLVLLVLGTVVAGWPWGGSSSRSSLGASSRHDRVDQQAVDVDPSRRTGW